MFIFRILIKNHKETYNLTYTHLILAGSYILQKGSTNPLDLCPYKQLLNHVLFIVINVSPLPS